jgi:hypothetical protein
MTEFVISSETATAKIAAIRESIAYKEGIMVVVIAAEMERHIVPKSRDAIGSSLSERGSVDVRGVAAVIAASTALGAMGLVTIIVGGRG